MLKLTHVEASPGTGGEGTGADAVGTAAAPAEMVHLHEAARWFGVNPSTVKRWEQEGSVPASVRVGSRRLYPAEALRRVLAESGRMSPSEPYPDPDRPGVWRVPLATSEIRRLEAIIDAGSLPVVLGRRWNWSGSIVILSHAKAITPLRRLILGVTDGRQFVRHVNGDPLDCRRQNLVVRTPHETARAARKMGTVSGREYTSRFKGVCWCSQTGRWLAQIRREGKGGKLGRFDSEIEAAEAYDRAARELFGEHAYLNFPDAAPHSTAAAPTARAA